MVPLSGQAVRDLELLAKVLDPGDMRNRVEYIPYQVRAVAGQYERSLALGS